MIGLMVNSDWHSNTHHNSTCSGLFGVLVLCTGASCRLSASLQGLEGLKNC